MSAPAPSRPALLVLWGVPCGMLLLLLLLLAPADWPYSYYIRHKT